MRYANSFLFLFLTVSLLNFGVLEIRARSVDGTIQAAVSAISAAGNNQSKADKIIRDAAKILPKEKLPALVFAAAKANPKLMPAIVSAAIANLNSTEDRNLILAIAQAGDRGKSNAAVIVTVVSGPGIGTTSGNPAVTQGPGKTGETSVPPVVPRATSSPMPSPPEVSPS